MKSQQSQNLSFQHQETSKKNNSIDEQLIQSAANHNFQKTEQLLKQGANPNHIRFTDADVWYSGNTHTALYEAVHGTINNPNDFLNVVELLLQNGADPNFKARCGGWNHSTEYPIFCGISEILGSLEKKEDKLRFIDIYGKYGGDMNHFVFKILDQFQIRSKVVYIPYYIKQAEKQQQKPKQQSKQLLNTLKKAEEKQKSKQAKITKVNIIKIMINQVLMTERGQKRLRVFFIDVL